MKKIVRLVVFGLALAGTVASFATSTKLISNGDPAPVCDPSNPTCKVVPQS